MYCMRSLYRLRTVMATVVLGIAGIALLVLTNSLIGGMASPLTANAAATVTMDVNISHDWVIVSTDSDAVATVEVVGKATSTGDAGEDGQYRTFEHTWSPSHPNIATGDRVIAVSDGITVAVDPIGAINGVLDFDGNTVSGTIHAPWFSPTLLDVRCEVWSSGGPGITVTGIEPDGGNYSCDFSTESWDLQPDQMIAVRYIEPDGDSVIVILEPPRMDVNYAHNWVEVWADASLPVTVTVENKAVVTGTTNGEGRFASFTGNWTPNNPDLVPGDIVTAIVGIDVIAVNPIGSIDGAADYSADTVAGTVNAPWLAPDLLTVRCEVWEEGGPNFELTDIDPDGGNFLCDFGAAEWDLLPTHTVAVRYVEPSGNQVINTFEAPSARVNYAEDWVGVDYPLGHTFAISVTDAGGALKATAQVDTRAGGGWGSDGFQTNGDDWQPEQPNIETGDQVDFNADDGYRVLIDVGEISGTVNLVDNSVSGPIYADWLSGPLTVACHPWGAWPGPAQVKQSTAAVDGSSPYLCQWPDSEWDMQSGQNTAVFYIIPGTRHMVGNVFSGSSVRHVATATGSDAGPNSCEDPASPCKTIGHAVAQAANGDEIRIAEGTYPENVVIANTTFMVRGGYAVDGDTWIPNAGETIIQGGATDRVVFLDNTRSTLENLTLTGGQAESGAGLRIDSGSNVTIRNCRVGNNAAQENGGGIHSLDFSNVEIVASAIYGNSSQTGEGGGILVEGGRLVLRDSWVVGNASRSNEGGGVAVERASMLIENSIIAGNTATNNAGGGIWLFGEGSFQIVNSHIVGNETTGPGAAVGIKDGSRLEISNSLLAYNVGGSGLADRDGDESLILLSYCNTYENSADAPSGVTIARDNCLGTPSSAGVDPQMTGGALPTGVGPDFADEWMAYNFRPRMGSPLIDAGLNSAAPTADIVRVSRPRDGTLDDDATVDLGAYEFDFLETFMPNVAK